MDTEQDPTRYRLFVGVDIAAATAMAAWQGEKGKVSRPVQIAQSPQGHADLHAKLGARGVPAAETLVGCRVLLERKTGLSSAICGNNGL